VELSFNNFKFRFELIMTQYYWKYFNSMSQIIKIQKYETKFLDVFAIKRWRHIGMLFKSPVKTGI
jgi:hypothetical protein